MLRARGVEGAASFLDERRARDAWQSSLRGPASGPDAWHAGCGRSAATADWCYDVRLALLTPLAALVCRLIASARPGERPRARPTKAGPSPVAFIVWLVVIRCATTRRVNAEKCRRRRGCSYDSLERKRDQFAVSVASDCDPIKLGGG